MKRIEFELPLYENPSTNFVGFVNKLGIPLKQSCLVFYRQGKLTFSCDNLQSRSSRASISVPSSLSPEETQELHKEISTFMSKFNLVNSLGTDQIVIFLELLQGKKIPKPYPKDKVKALIKVRIFCEKEMYSLLEKNFSVVDSGESAKRF